MVEVKDSVSQKLQHITLAKSISIISMIVSIIIWCDWHNNPSTFVMFLGDSFN